MDEYNYGDYCHVERRKYTYYMWWWGSKCHLSIYLSIYLSIMLRIVVFYISRLLYCIVVLLMAWERCMHTPSTPQGKESMTIISYIYCCYLWITRDIDAIKRERERERGWKILWSRICCNYCVDYISKSYLSWRHGSNLIQSLLL